MHLLGMAAWLSAVYFVTVNLATAQEVIIQDDFSQPNYDTGNHTPYNVYGTNIWDGAPGGLGLPPNYQTTPGHTNLGIDLPGGVWQYGGGAAQDYDANETGNLPGYGASGLLLTGGTSPVCYARLHNDENVGITTGNYNINATLTVTVSVDPTGGAGYVGFDSTLGASNNTNSAALNSIPRAACR